MATGSEKLSGNSTAGFTLVELIVSFAILGLITTIIFIDFRSGNNVLALERSAQKVAQDIRRTVASAIETQQGTPCDGGTKEPTGYGIYFKVNKSSYVIYAECSKDGDGDGIGDRPGFEPVSCPAPYSCSSSGGPVSERDVFLRGIKLESPVFIDSINASGGSSWSLVFFPPDPIAVMCKNGHGPCVGGNKISSASVTISNGNLTKTIQVNKGGFVDVN